MSGLSLSHSQYGESQYGTVQEPTDQDLSIRIGRVFFDTHVPPQPTVTVGETTAFTGTIERDGVGYFEARYNAARDYIARANESVETGTMKDGSGWFSEFHDDQTLLVRVTTGRDHRYVRDYWGVIVDGTDETNQVFGKTTITLTLLILAQEQEYDSRRDTYDEFGR